MVSSCLSLSPGMFWQELQKGTGTPKIRHLNHPGVWIFKQSSTRWGFSYSLSMEYIVQNLGVSSKAVNQWEKLVHSWGGGGTLQKIHCNSPNLIHFVLSFPNLLILNKLVLS